jgi:glycerol kinase
VKIEMATRESTTFGAAIAAGFAIDIWTHFDELKRINQKFRKYLSPRSIRKEAQKYSRNRGRIINLSQLIA